MLAIFLDNLIPTLEKFKQIIRILIQEVKNLHLELQNKERTSDPLETEMIDLKQNAVEGLAISNQTFEGNGLADDKDLKNFKRPN